MLLYHILSSMPTIHHAYFNTTEAVDTFNATHDIKRVLRDSPIKDGLLTVFVPSTVAGVVVLENDPQIQEEYKKLLLSFVEEPSAARPPRRSGTGTTSVHLRAALLPQSVSIPVIAGKSCLGPWQEVIVYDFDSRVGRLEVVMQLLGEGGGEKK